jgi:membrane protease YdiL (CAAX protease family)
VLIVLALGSVATLGATAILGRGSIGAATSAVVLEVCTGLTVVGWVALLHRGSLRGLGWTERPGAELLYGLVVGVAAYLVVAIVAGALLSLLFGFFSDQPVHAPRQLPTGLHGVAAGLTVLSVLIAPISEELLFRGFLFRSLRYRRGFLLSALVPSVLFGLAHYQPAAWQSAFLLVGVMFLVGFALSWICERRGNVVAPIGAHFAFNVIGLLLITTRGPL